MATPNDAAVKMLEWFRAGGGQLLQLDAACRLEQAFGSGTFTYYNANGNPAINPAVLRAFRSMSGPDVVWSRSLFMWRKRHPSDPRDGRQVY